MVIAVAAIQAEGELHDESMDGDKYPKEGKGGRRAATTLLFLPNAIRPMKGI